MTYEYYRVMRTVADRMQAKHDSEVPVGANRPSNMLQMDRVISKLKAFRPMLLQNTTDIARVANNLKALRGDRFVKHQPGYVMASGYLVGSHIHKRVQSRTGDQYEEFS
jgi:hypothetical protein